MNLIVAIDIKKGSVVKAFAGLREAYKPLIINKKNYSNPFFYIKFLSQILNIKKIYIADLDSINGSKENWEIIRNVIQENTSINFFLDLGFSNQKMLSDFESLIEFKRSNVDNYKFIIGTESLQDIKSLSNFGNKSKMLVSLDFNGSEDLWIKNIIKLEEFDKIILMFINKVGGRGLDWKVLEKLRKYLDPKKTVIAGGIKNKIDINKLKNIGYNGIIVSSVIHKIIESKGVDTPK